MKSYHDYPEQEDSEYKIINTKPMQQPIKLFFYAGRNAGMTVMLGAMAKGWQIMGVVPVDNPIREAAELFQIPIFESINSPNTKDFCLSTKVDLIVCCHGREIIGKELLDAVPGINIHPCLSKYPGARPLKRLLDNGDTEASVGVHWLTPDVDRGQVICERYMPIEGKTEIEIYNELYPLYLTTGLEGIGLAYEFLDTDKKMKGEILI